MMTNLSTSTGFETSYQQVLRAGEEWLIAELQCGPAWRSAHIVASIEHLYDGGWHAFVADHIEDGA